MVAMSESCTGKLCTIKGEILTSSPRYIGTNTDSKNKALVHTALQARKRVEEGRTAGRNRDLENLLRWDYDRTNQDYNPYETKGPREPPLMTKGTVPEEMTSEDGRKEWTTVNLYKARSKYVSEQKKRKLREYKGQ